MEAWMREETPPEPKIRDNIERLGTYRTTGQSGGPAKIGNLRDLAILCRRARILPVQQRDPALVRLAVTCSI
jgi:hypothetical protein